jgi:cyclohexa-1,5-dienecarbonyl-CoA hydratase
MSFSSIQFFPGPRVAGIVLNRPPLNIINIEMMDEIEDAWDETSALEAQVVVISGAGAQAFSAGVDVADHAPDKAGAMLKKFHRVIRMIWDSGCITIAAVHGRTLGGGFELAMVCDFVIAAEDAEIGLPEISLACYPPVAAAYLPRVIGRQRASEMVLLGDPISAADAEQLGLVNTVVPREDLNTAVDDYVDRLLAKSAAALRFAKRALRVGWDHSFEMALEKNENLYLKELLNTEDAQEGVRAFLEKRPPSWKNR